MSDVSRRFEPGTLWPTIVERTRLARQCGALSPIETETHVLEDHGVTFQARVVSSLVRKEVEPRPDPFLPYEPDLFVADVSDTHLCLLNKYNVIDNHVLIVTRAFERQESALTLNDFDALWACMPEYEALAFYNSAAAAGASQPHKHLQLVPLPLTSGGPALPLESLIESAPRKGGPVRIDRLPFVHAFAWLDAGHRSEPRRSAEDAHALYLTLLEAVGFEPQSAELPPYNLLATRRFLLLIPRTHASFEGVPVSALAFVGSFFIPNRTCFDVIRRVGPMTVLREVSLKLSRSRPLPH